MAKAIFVKKARKPIYAIGALVTKVHQDGKRKGESYVSRDKSQPHDRLDTILINAGESYYWWQFKGAEKSYSKTMPLRSQLTRSQWLSSAYALEEGLEGETASNLDELELLQQNLSEEIGQLMDGIDDVRTNMPEQLQESSVLTEYYDALESWQSEVDGIDIAINTDDLYDDAVQLVDDEVEQSEGVTPEDRQARIDVLYSEKLQNAIDEVVAEIKSTSSGL